VRRQGKHNEVRVVSIDAVAQVGIIALRSKTLDSGKRIPKNRGRMHLQTLRAILVSAIGSIMDDENASAMRFRCFQSAGSRQNQAMTSNDMRCRAET
jgi:hypothetical protein